MNCPNCGATNDPNNQFCDQCGTKLQQPAVSAAPPVSSTPPAPSAAPTCPTCGSVILPGEAFCDNCGASLVGLAPVPESAVVPVSEELPTVIAAPLPEPDPLDVTPLPEPLPVVEALPEPIPEPVPATQPTDATVFGSAPVSAPIPEPVPVLVEPTPAPAIDAQADYEAKKLSYEAEVTRSQQVVTQLEAVQAALGVATPAGVLQSLDEARASLATAQSDLAALVPPTPVIDPAVVAALNSEIAGQQQVVTQLEAVQAALGVATPAGVLQSLDAARSALTKLQADLAALGVAPAVAAVAAPVPVAAPVAVSDSNAPTMVAPVAAIPATQAAPPPVPVAAPAATGPRLIVEDGGKELPLATGKTEFIIGRSDPISGIYPEVDLTSYGGETSGVSRQHARLVLNAGQWLLTDLNSTNHTKIDGVRIDPNVPAPVQNGARLQFGRLTLLFKV